MQIIWFKRGANYWKSPKDKSWQQNRLTNIVVKIIWNSNKQKNWILGFAFKSNTNDTRESPAISICANLLQDVKLSIYDPKVKFNQICNNFKDLNNADAPFKFEDSLSMASSYEELANNSDAILILTEWEEFKKIEWSKISKINA